MTEVTAHRVLIGDQPQPMTVEDLRAILDSQPSSAWVVVSSDAEQNQHKPLLEVQEDVATVYQQNGYGAVEFEVSPTSLTLPKMRRRCVVLVPYD